MSALTPIPNPIPDCEVGFTQPQLADIFGAALPDFEKWMSGQTRAICEGRKFNHDTREYETSCRGVHHGVVTYPWDVQRYIRNLPIID